MQNLRNAKLIARFVLVWFALSIGVAVASPLVKPQSMQLVCSGSGAMKVVAVGGDGKAQPVSHTLDCPLCAALGAPGPTAFSFSPVAPVATALAPAWVDAPAFTPATPPPSRGPPSLS